MKAHLIRFVGLTVATILTLPAIALAVPPSDSAYYTDAVSSYVQDQVSDDLSQLNSLLCMLGAMAPHLMVNQGDYIALIDQNSCSNNGSGGQGNNTGASYLTAQVNSSRTSNSEPMKTKIWFDIPGIEVPMYATASRAPSKYLPYGVFRMDYCVKLPTDTNCDRQKGFINASTDGLAFYTSSQSGTSFRETILQLSSTSSTNSGKGVVVKYDGSIPPNPTVTVFAYSPDYFYRDDGSSSTSGQCFSRSTRYAEKSAWRYGLYDATTGARFMHQSGFPIEYTDTSVTPNVTYNGYISYWGLSMPVTVPQNATVNQISYDTSPPTKTPYTMVQSGGKLIKYSTISKKLSALNKLPIWYWAYNTVTVNGGSITSMASGNYYEIYWDDTNQYFKVSGQYNSTSGNMEPLAIQGNMTNAAMVAADTNLWGLSGWSQLLGGSFYISGADFANLATTLSNTNVTTQTQDVVYPQDMAAVSAAGLNCIGDCPTAASMPTLTSPGWGPFSSLISQSYTLDPATGNLLDSTLSPVVQTNSTTIYSGRLISNADAAAILAIKPVCASAPCYSQSDVDLLTTPTYYIWQTSSNSWDQMAFLKDANGVNVTFYPPLPVNFAVPNDSVTYGNLAGSTISLQYGEFGNLWGIPNKCIDITNNTDCVFGATPTPSNNQRWTPQFSIPTDTVTGIVSAGVTQGPVTQGTPYLVKALDEEIRLSQVNKNLCLVLGLTEPVSISRLATYSDWIDPTPLIGAKSVLNPVPAPRVIHGVVQY